MAFFVSGAVYIFGAFIFIILGEDGIAKWTKENDSDDAESENKMLETTQGKLENQQT